MSATAGGSYPSGGGGGMLMMAAGGPRGMYEESGEETLGEETLGGWRAEDRAPPRALLLLTAPPLARSSFVDGGGSEGRIILAFLVRGIGTWDSSCVAFVLHGA
mmetsp:Transcript_74534/g.199284  ORF Transcript_74534/g.199284 Transcript_74534/m.199284 type:complete len:104 (+) Transcript_74534:2567-2878(+)